MKESKLNFGATPEIFRRAKELRHRMTHSEKILWEKLKDKKFNDLKIRRQHPAGKFILDFYCHEYKLAIELDGDVHDNVDVKSRDLGREEELNSLGITVIRFRNSQVLNEIELVFQHLLREIALIKSKK